VGVCGSRVNRRRGCRGEVRYVRRIADEPDAAVQRSKESEASGSSRFAFVRDALGGEAMKGAVELAVAAGVEAVSDGVARGGWDRGAAAGARELCVRREAVGAGDLADQLGGGQRAAAPLLKQLRRVALDEEGELCLEFADALCAVIGGRAGGRWSTGRRTPTDPRAGSRRWRRSMC
jgi:hypothetical protein